MISIQEEYRGLLSGILYGGKQKSDRTGTGTLSIFGRSIKHDMALGFPLLTTKKVYFNHAITELLWILQAAQILSIFINIMFLIGTPIMNVPVGQMVLLEKYMVLNGEISMVLTNCYILLTTSKRIRPQEDYYLTLGTLLILTIWLYLLVIMDFKFM